MPRVSVVVPVYNVETYLPQCIDSIRAQTLADIEIICVNDGSTDRSGKILDLYASLDERVVVISKSNNGVSSARNDGIDRARGDIICFVDADDVLMPKACATVVRAFEEHDVDVVKFSATPFPACCSNPWIDSTLTLPDKVFEGYSDQLVFEEHSRPFPWNGAYRAAFLREHGIRFPEGIALGEDQVFCFAALARARGAALLSDRLYRYRLSRTDSAMAAAARDLATRVEKHLTVVEAILDDWAAAGRMQGESARRMLTFVMDFVMPNICELGDDDARDRLLRHLQQILVSRCSREDVSSWLDGDRIHSWALRVYDYAGDAPAFGGHAIYGLVGALYGRRAELGRRRADLSERLFGRLRRWRRRHFSPSADELLGALDAQRSMVEEKQQVAASLELLQLELASRGDDKA